MKDPLSRILLIAPSIIDNFASTLFCKVTKFSGRSKSSDSSYPTSTDLEPLINRSRHP
jgi:hypothetical protein